jgi:DNA-binding response OmpR family regulator
MSVEEGGTLAVLGDVTPLPIGWAGDAPMPESFEDSDRFLLSPAPFGFDLYLVLPWQRGLSALDLVRIVRRRVPHAAVLALTDDWPGAVGPWLDAGADMVLPVTLSAEQLQAALAALRRRRNRQLVGDGWRLLSSPPTLVLPDDLQVGLSEPEFIFLACLADAPGHVAQRQALVECLWGASAGPMENALQALVHQLRRRIERVWPHELPLHPVEGGGYEFRKPLSRSA